MNAHKPKQAIRGMASAYALLAVGFFLIFVLAFVLGLQTVGLFNAAWRSAFGPLAKPTVLARQTCVGELPPPAVARGPKTKGTDGTPVTLTLECQPKKEPGSAEKPTDPIAAPNTADTLSALGVVVVLVTLMLTLGSTYLAEKQKELEQLLGKERQRQTLEELLTQALVNLHEYFLHNQPNVAAQDTLDCGLRLRLLQSSDEDQRGEMNVILSRRLGPGNAADLPHVVRYVAEVKRYLKAHILKSGQATQITFLD